MSWKPPRSPYNLIQEHLWQDPWKIFVACIFCNLTRRVDAEPYMWKFFERYPTPVSVSEANVDDIVDMKDVKDREDLFRKFELGIASVI